MRKPLVFVSLILSLQLAAQKNKILHPAPVVNFGATGLCLGDSTCFLNKTQMAQDFTWNVYKQGTGGDSLIKESNEKDICMLFPSAGNYRVVLWADNGHLVNKSDTFILGTKTKADFSFVPCENDFINRSSCTDSSFWDFGDGITSSSLMPNHKYKIPGTYTVTLIVKNGSKSDTVSKSVVVKSTGYPSAGFTYTADPDSVYFLANDTTGDEYYWSFGDTTYANKDSTGWKISHHYFIRDSIYEVSLMVRNSCGISSLWLPVDPRIIGLGEDKGFFSFRVYPNPAFEQFFFSIRLDVAQEMEISLFDISGREVMKRNFNYIPGSNAEAVSVSGISPGIYNIQLRTKEYSFHSTIALVQIR